MPEVACALCRHSCICTLLHCLELNRRDGFAGPSRAIGLRVDESILCVVDGGKGIRKALVDVLGDLAVIQRCQIHKLRNLRSYLPKSLHAYVLIDDEGSLQEQEC